MPEPTEKNFSRRRRLDAEARHELEVIDRVLVGSHEVAADDAETAQFALRMRAERPQLDERAVTRLDARFAQRIAEEREFAAVPPRRARLNSRFAALGARPLQVAGGLATLLVVAVVSFSLSGSTGERGDQSGYLSGEPQTRAESAGASGVQSMPEAKVDLDEQLAKQKSTAPASTVPTDIASGDAFRAPTGSSNSAIRRVERSADLTLATPSANVEDVADDVISVTDRFGGYVATSSVTGGDSGNAAAEFVLSLPADRFQKALAAYSGLAHVRARTQSTQDVTDAYERATDRLKSARAESDRLRAKLAATTGDAEAKALRARLRTAEARESARRREMQAMRNRVSNVTLDLTIVADETVEAADRGTIADALHKAGSILTGVAAVAIVSLAIIAPFALLFAAGGWLVRRRRAHRADETIESASAPE